MGKFLDNRLKFHTASRIGAQTGYSLAQALDPDGHIVRHTGVWAAPDTAFPKNAIITTDPEKATADLTDVFFTQFALTADLEFASDKKYYKPVKTTVEGSDAPVVVDYEEDESIDRVDAEGNPQAVPADTYYERVAVVTYRNGDVWKEEDSNIVKPVAGRVYRSSAYPAIELYYKVSMTGVPSSDGGDSSGKYQAYHITKNGASTGTRIMDWVAPTAVIKDGSPVAGFSGIAEAQVGGTWTVLQKVSRWALSAGTWEFAYISGMLVFDPEYTPNNDPENPNTEPIRFTGFKYIGEYLSDAVEDHGTAIATLEERLDNISNSNIEGAAGLQSQIDVNKGAIATAQSDIATAKSDIEQLDKDVNEKIQLMYQNDEIDTKFEEVNKAFDIVNGEVGIKANSADVYTKTQVYTQAEANAIFLQYEVIDETEATEPEVAE